MKSLRLFDRRVGFSLGALGILMGMVAPAVLPAFASAAQLSSRSISMSNSTADAANVTYTLNFTPTVNATDMIIYFCDNSPLGGATCDTAGSLAGFDLSGANTLSSGSLDSTSNDTGNPGGTDGNQIAITGLTLTASTPATISFEGVHNPTAANSTFYARIETFDTEAHQKASWAAGPTDTSYDTDGDFGGVALSTTNEIGVTAAVLESLQFCTFGDTNNGATGATANSATYLSSKTDATGGPTGGCGANSNPAPSIQLGETVAGSTVALSTTVPSYGAGWSQISTNASGGALVYLKDNTLCTGSTPDVGLVLNNSTKCGIAPQNGTLSNGVAGFGITFGGGGSSTAFAAPSGGTATGGIDFNSHYTGGQYSLTTSGQGSDSFNGSTNGIDTISQDVSSTSGAPVFETNDGTKVGPATNQDVPFGVGASIAANTPAGLYKANLSLIAVGTF